MTGFLVVLQKFWSWSVYENNCEQSPISHLFSKIRHKQSNEAQNIFCVNNIGQQKHLGEVGMTKPALIIIFPIEKESNN